MKTGNIGWPLSTARAACSATPITMSSCTRTQRGRSGARTARAYLNLPYDVDAVRLAAQGALGNGGVGNLEDGFHFLYTRSGDDAERILWKP